LAAAALNTCQPPFFAALDFDASLAQLFVVPLRAILREFVVHHRNDQHQRGGDDHRQTPAEAALDT